MNRAHAKAAGLLCWEICSSWAIRRSVSTSKSAFFARGLRIDRVIAVGELAKNIADGASGGDVQVIWCEKKEELYNRLDQFAGAGDIILVKGSRGMKMEQIAERILKI